MKHVLFLLLLMTLSACGGGGGSNSETSTSPPVDDDDNSEGSVELTAEEKYRDAVIELREEVNTPGVFEYDLLNAVSIDLDADGDMDLVLAGSKNNWKDKQEVVIFRNNSNESFARENTGINGSFRAASVADFNGDGLDDLFFADHGLDEYPWPGAQDQLLVQTIEGGLAEVTASSLPIHDTYTHSSCALDLKVDGMMDIYQGVLGYPAMLENQGNKFVEVEMPDLDYATEDYSEIRNLTFPWCTVADVDSDSDDDLILGNGSTHDAVDAEGNPVGRAHIVLFSDNGVLAYRGPDSQIESQGKQFLPVGDDAGVAIGMVAEDFNQDNCSDLAVLETNYTSEAVIEIFINDCAGNYTSVQMFEGVDTDVHHLRAVDLNDDGLLDVIAASYIPRDWYAEFSDQGYRVLISKGDGTFETRAPEASDIEKLPLEFAAFWYAN